MLETRINPKNLFEAIFKIYLGNECRIKIKTLIGCHHSYISERALKNLQPIYFRNVGNKKLKLHSNYFIEKLFAVQSAE